MRNLSPWSILACLIGILGLAPNALSHDLAVLRPLAEQSARLSEFETRGRIYLTASSKTDSVQVIADGIRRAQGAEPYFRKPLSWAEIAQLKDQLNRSTGRHWQINQVAAAVDYTHAHMRESRASTPAVFREKLLRSLTTERKAFHGQIAELAEARERGMVLTKSTRSETFDLTEPNQRPRSLQLKVVKDPVTALRVLQEDLKDAHPRARRGSLPLNQVAYLEQTGKLREVRMAGNQRVFVATSGPRITVLPMRSFESVAASQHYAHTGRAMVSTLRQPSYGYPWLGHTLAFSALVGAPLIALEAFQHGNHALSLFNDPSTRDSPLPYLHLAITVGHTAEVANLTWMAASHYSTWGLQNATLFGMGATQVFLPLAIGVQTVKLGTTVYAYHTGRIGFYEFQDRIAGPAYFVAFTGGGALVCSFIPGVGTAICATTGAIISIPVTLWDRTFRQNKRVQLAESLYQYKLAALGRRYVEPM